MRILQVFNRYLERGGEEMSVERVAATLRKEHLMFHCYFDSAEFHEKPRSFLNSILQALLMVYNPSAVKRFKSQIAACRPDVILLHNVFPVGSIGVYLTAIQSGIPVLHYIHNFRPFSVNGYLWGKDCMITEGLRKNFWPEIIAGSWQGSRLKTAWYAAIISVMHWLGIYRRIDGWLAISKFMRETFISAGIPKDKVFLLRHSWDVARGDMTPNHAPSRSSQVSDVEPMILFLGRLTEAKGLRVLIEAWKQLKDEGIPGRLIIGGEGPMANWIINQQVNGGQFEYLGFISGPQKKDLLKECRAMVVPSIWWEPLGLVVYEAYQYNRPVIAAQSGGLSETIIDGETGWLYPPLDSKALKECMIAALKSEKEASRRGEIGKAWVLQNTGSHSWLYDFNAILDAVTKNKNQVTKTSAFPNLPSNAGNAISPPPPQPFVTIPRELTSAHRSHSELKESVTADRAGSGSSAESGYIICSCSFPLSALQISDLHICLTAYLADQNPGHDRSYGISRMSQVVLDSLAASGQITIVAITSKTSQQVPSCVAQTAKLPWGTRRNCVRFFTDHFHPMFRGMLGKSDCYYYPKGYLPFLSGMCRPSVVTVHDTIIQYDQDHYPKWRSRWEYAYWTLLLRHTLRKADRILTVSESSREQIRAFMARHKIPAREITITYESCAYENVAQPDNPKKGDNVIHLASVEPHKRTAHLIRWWYEAEVNGKNLPSLHLIGSIPPEVLPILSKSKNIVKRPFLEDHALQEAYKSAKALILPSEIEGFGLPALEAYYLGTPVCFVKGTSVGEVLSASTHRGGFSLESIDSMISALEDVMSMTSDEVRTHGLKLRETYTSEKVAARLMVIFQDLVRK
jgi:glycosyltransferase involved in cell wall biosynthesis